MKEKKRETETETEEGGRGNGMCIELLQGRGRGAAPSFPGAAVAAAGCGGGGRRGGGEAGVPARTAWFGGGGGDAMGCRDAANMISPDGRRRSRTEAEGRRKTDISGVYRIREWGGGNANFTTVLSFFPSYPAYDPLSFRGMATLIVVYVANCALTVGPNQNISACSSTVTISPPRVVPTVRQKYLQA